MNSMDTTTIVALTFTLIIVAVMTHGFWGQILIMIASVPVGFLARSYATEFLVMQTLAMGLSGGAVFVVGVVLLNLPWYAALIAGVIVGLTSYVRPNPEHSAHYDW
jgi:energy-coupling factor transporter transmembrane protein EcfT